MLLGFVTSFAAALTLSLVAGVAALLLPSPADLVAAVGLLFAAWAGNGLWIYRRLHAMASAARRQEAALSDASVAVRALLAEIGALARTEIAAVSESLHPARPRPASA
jgi:hypothetical protein